MKKSSIIAVGIIYLVSIILVGFIGVRMKIYDPIVYVENIVPLSIPRFDCHYDFLSQKEPD